MRGAEFSPSAKRSKINRSATNRSARGASITTLTLPSGELAPSRAGVPGATADEPASGVVANVNPGAESVVPEVAQPVSEVASSAAVSQVVVSESAQERSMRQPSNPERNDIAPARRGEERPASSPLASVAPLGQPKVAAPRSELNGALGEVRLSDRVVFNDEKLARRYASEPIPISTLYEAYFDGSLDIPGDLVEFLRSRKAFVKHTITRQHLQWAVTNFVPEMVAHSREADARSARELFDDRGDDFFRAFLGDRLAFTCALFDTPADSLDNASEQMSARICEKIGLRQSHRVLEVGCGWGAFLGHVAASRGVEGFGTTLSRAQELHANRRFVELGVERQVRASLLDYRDLQPGTYDRIVCLEAVERVGVKNLKGFFEKLREHLVDDGLFFLQWTGLRRSLQPEDLMWGLFMNKHIFPGADAGLPLSSMLKVAEKSGWEVQGVENVSRHYGHTLRVWRSNWESHRQSIVAEHGERWFRIWQFFLAWSQIVAEQGSAACFQVVMNKNLDSLDRRQLYT
jgi:cyclopropane fatty-acyl-phospholipid synthase-like methyltransferase